MAPALGLAYGYYTLEQLRGRTAVEHKFVGQIAWEC